MCCAAHTAHTNPGDLAANCDYFQALFSNYQNFADTADVSRLAVHTGMTQACPSAQSYNAAANAQAVSCQAILVTDMHDQQQHRPGLVASSPAEHESLSNTLLLAMQHR